MMMSQATTNDEETSTMSQRLICVGPNLPNELAELGTMHFHAEGCAHLNRAPLRIMVDKDGWATEYATIRDAVLDVYPPDQFDYDADSNEYEGYREDLYFAPCVKLTEG